MSVALYNIQGEMVNTLLDANLPAGTHVFDVGLSSLSSGAHFYRIAAPGNTATKKMVLAR